MTVIEIQLNCSNKFKNIVTGDPHQRARICFSVPMGIRPMIFLENTFPKTYSIFSHGPIHMKLGVRVKDTTGVSE